MEAADALYQHRSAADGEIVLVGIDDRAIEQFGPYGQWDRDIISMVLEALNQSEDCRCSDTQTALRGQRQGAALHPRFFCKKIE